MGTIKKVYKASEPRTKSHNKIKHVLLIRATKNARGAIMTQR